MHITHRGHACLLVEAAGQRLLLDPGTFSDLVGLTHLDAILITHQHADHADPQRLPALLAANPDAPVHAGEATLAALTEALGQHPTATLVPGQDVTLGDLRIAVVGDQHAEIHPYLPRVENRGLVVHAPGEPILFHPGDALDAEPGEVDLLCVPVNAPWGKVAETIAFVRRVAPARGVVPIHDGLLTEPGREIYLTHIRDFGAEGGIEVLDLRGAGRTEV